MFSHLVEHEFFAINVKYTNSEGFHYDITMVGYLGKIIINSISNHFRGHCLLLWLHVRDFTYMIHISSVMDMQNIWQPFFDEFLFRRVSIAIIYRGIAELRFMPSATACVTLNRNSMFAWPRPVIGLSTQTTTMVVKITGVNGIPRCPLSVLWGSVLTTLVWHWSGCRAGGTGMRPPRIGSHAWVGRSDDHIVRVVPAVGLAVFGFDRARIEMGRARGRGKVLMMIKPGHRRLGMLNMVGTLAVVGLALQHGFGQGDWSVTVVAI